jgi:pimeloyl-ACP methyl ester carboxylesterase
MPANWKNKGKYFLYKNKHRIFYRREGSGPVLLLLHGFPTASWDWHKIWPSLKEDFELVAPDFMGFGFSDKPLRYQYGILDQADLVEQLLDHLQLREVHILAHDYGDTVAQELLARFLEKKASAMKIDINLFSKRRSLSGVSPAKAYPKTTYQPFGPFADSFSQQGHAEEKFF